MFLEQMEKLITVLSAYQPNPAWTVELFVIILMACIIGIILNNIYK